MNKKHFRLGALAMTLCMVWLCACNVRPQGNADGTGSESGSETATDTKAEETKLKLTEYQVIYAEKATDKTKRAAELLGSKLGRAARPDTVSIGAKEILIGDTNRAESATAKAALTETEATAFRVAVTNGKVTLVGKDESSIVLGVKRFLGTALANGETEIAEDHSLIYATDGKITVFDDLSVLEIGEPSVIFGADRYNQSAKVNYPRVIVLEHNGENNGVMLATMQSTEMDGYRIFRSDDEGKTWKEITQVRNRTHDRVLAANWQPTIFELPTAVGDMPAGTLLLSGCAHRTDGKNDLITTLCVWKSTDLGKTWTHISDVADSYVSKGGNGVWEPVFEMSDDGKLVCFYSDENDRDNHSQTLLYRTSTDGVHWSESSPAVALSNPSLRPGMITLVRLNNGKYFATYEVVGLKGGPVHFRIADSLTDWGDVSKIGTLMLSGNTGMGTSPAVGYAPNVGECGMLFVAAEHMVENGTYDKDTVRFSKLFVSLDYGATWTILDNPMPYQLPAGLTSGQGYSSNFFTCADGHTVYFSQATDWDWPAYGNQTTNKIVKMQVW